MKRLKDEIQNLKVIFKNEKETPELNEKNSFDTLKENIDVLSDNVNKLNDTIGKLTDAIERLVNRMDK